MPRQSKGAGRGSQVRNKSARIAAEALAASRKRLAQAGADLDALDRSSPKAARAAARLEKKRATEANLRAEMAQLATFGLYNPKGRALTKSRKATIRKRFIEYEDLQRHAVFAPFPTRKKSERSKIASEVTRSGGKATRRGVFLPREEGELRKGDVRLVKDRATGLWEARQTYRYTNAQGERRTITATRYLEGAEALERQEAILRRKFDAMQKSLGKNEAIRFTIGGPQGNVSRASFRSWDAFKRRVMAYRRDPRAQASFMASLTVYVAAKESPQSRRYRVPVAWADKRGRRRNAAPENLYAGGLFPMPKADRRDRRGRKRRKPTK